MGIIHQEVDGNQTRYVFESKAIFKVVQTHCKGKITNMSDNITVVSYVIHKGGIKSEFCNEIA